MKYLFNSKIIVLIFIFSAFVYSQVIFEKPLSERIANYNISVYLDPVEKVLNGEELLVWKNSSNSEIKDLQFHLYWNAFKNLNSTFLTESRWHLREEVVSQNAFGYIDIESIKINENEDLTGRIEYIAPDDGNQQDRTVFKVTLTKPVKPDEIINLKIKFKSRIPKLFCRSGYSKEFFMIGQWFPKIGVYENSEENIGWNCHQYHRETEFFSDFGEYNVDITIPNEYTVAATGLKIKEKNNLDGTKIISYRAEDVHDFVWCAYPYFKEMNEKWNGIEIRLLYPEDHQSVAFRNMHAIKYALAYMDSIVGKYPYPNITIIDPPFFASEAGGMEYPTLFTTSSLWGFDCFFNFPEVVTVHEFLHQYFYGLLASNEFEEAWLDEGFTQYMESRIMQSMLGRDNSFIDFLGFKIGDLELSRSFYTGKRAKNDFTLNKSYNFKTGDYGRFVYMKPALFLSTLQGFIGDDQMNKILAKYYNNFKFRHPKTKDFLNTAYKVLDFKTETYPSLDVKYFFNQVLYGTDVCDYSVYSIVNKSMKDSLISKENKTDSLKYLSTVIIQRLGELILPVDIKLTFEDGSVKFEKWDGKDRYKLFTYSGFQKVIEVEIDPMKINYLDVNILNNSLTLLQYPLGYWKYILDFFSFIQNILQTIVIFA